MWRNFIIRAISRQKQVIFISFMIKDKPLLTVVAPPVTLLFADPFFTPSCLLQVGTTFFSTSRPLLIKSLFLFLLPLLSVLLSSLSLEFAGRRNPRRRWWWRRFWNLPRDPGAFRVDRKPERKNNNSKY